MTTVLFDLDGTILDTNELIIQSFLHALQNYVPAEFGREHIIPSMGMPLVYQMQQFSGLEDVSHIVAAYREVNLRLHDELVRAFPFVPEVLEELHRSGIKLGVVTTKMRLTTERGLQYVGIADFMSSVVTIDDVQHPKPHPEPVQIAMKELGANPAETVMVGDSVVDIQAANEAGTVSVGVAWSLKGEDTLREAGAKHMIHDMRELLELVGLEREPLEKR
ncbi:pyrophosphatase [Paenibacillus darwinianus]|uniref:Pyrophosphatase n=1 Tax=Paenibacillus darwinianus TaxID=1380763 RepID=A0A9W5S1C2_9BACL|nr:pyrophosphatase [Paenibacillus darwinianus]EXX88182.1 pyrophosphatase [Paenibacillus darwinianus]EXX88453.1 pyrophosphatase [Paenibacillus darwinianus]